MTTSLTHRRADVSDQPVIEVMSQPVFAISADATLDQALRALLVAGLRHLVAVDDTGRFLGVLGDRQVAAAWARDPSGLSIVPVRAVLDPCTSTVSRAATLQMAARVMRDHRTDVVVVVDPARRAIGVVTAGDVVAAVAKPTHRSVRTR